ncbi:hypothetical protein HHK36_021359 [Tetracentron sinense]|uniref:Prolamin-like domain-containing protein n=1 Tax=Tetracentron sinense TaxID=13715 RepID=A0A835D7A4_TETSI|nr:hypothetical protein HHK36_021359 [Tetracentron sinense]
MVRRTRELSSLLLVVACMAMFVAFGQASIEPSYDQVDLFGLDPEIGQCLASLQTIEGCVEEVLTSFLSNQVGFIGPKCCQAITKIGENCWPKIFPLNPLFPPLLKDYCAHLVAPGPTQRISSRKITITTN